MSTRNIKLVMKEKLKIIRLLPAMILIGIFLVSCQSRIALIYNGNQGENKTLTAIKKIKSTDSDGLVVYKDTNNLNKSIPQEKVWGSMEGSGVVRRLYKGSFYLLEESAEFPIYSINHAEDKKTQHTHFYFSKGLNGDLFSLDWKNINREFSDDKEFLNLVKNGFKWYEDYSSYNRLSRTYKIVALYKACERFNHKKFRNNI